MRISPLIVASSLVLVVLAGCTDESQQPTLPGSAFPSISASGQQNVPARSQNPRANFLHMSDDSL